MAWQEGLGSPPLFSQAKRIETISNTPSPLLAILITTA